jgi:hypothetical protein
MGALALTHFGFNAGKITSRRARRPMDSFRRAIKMP